VIEKHKRKPILVLGGVDSPLKIDKHGFRTDAALQDKFMKLEDAMIYPDDYSWEEVLQLRKDCTSVRAKL